MGFAIQMPIPSVLGSVRERIFNYKLFEATGATVTHAKIGNFL